LHKSRSEVFEAVSQTACSPFLIISLKVSLLTARLPTFNFLIIILTSTFCLLNSQFFFGVQPGNQNARKHGFYASAFTGSDKVLYDQAARTAGLDDEIALVRARLKAALVDSPCRFRLINNAVFTLSNLVRISHKCGCSQAQRLEELHWKTMFVLGPQFGLSLEQIAAVFLGKFNPIGSSAGPPKNTRTNSNESP
jgi:hypothetical protein